MSEPIRDALIEALWEAMEISGTDAVADYVLARLNSRGVQLLAWRPIAEANITDRAPVLLHCGDEVGEGYYEPMRECWCWASEQRCVPQPISFMPLPEPPR